MQKKLRNTFIMTQKNWNTKDILKFANWLWEEKQYGFSLLAIHGVFLGLKTGTQLGLKWEDFIDEKGNPKLQLDLKGKEQNREISPLCAELNFNLFNELKPKKDDFIYVNFKTKKIIEATNLSKNLQRYAEAYLIENSIKIYDYCPIKGNSFQIAWARDILEFNNYSKRAFTDLTEFLGKKSIKELIEFVGVSPKEESTIRFDMIDIKNVKLHIQPVIKHKNAMSRPDFMFVFEE